MTRGQLTRPAVIAVDGRSGAGKTSLAVELAAALREHRSVILLHLEDFYPGWDGLAEGIRRCADAALGPLRGGEAARWRAWDWLADADGEERWTEPADVVVLEGVGAGAAPLRALADAVVWVEAPAEDRRRRALARDGETYAPHWDHWAAQEDAWLAADDVPSAAAVTVLAGAGTDRPEGATARVIDALAELPALREALAPERAARESRAVSARRLAASPDPEALFSSLFGASSHAVWLDSSDAGAVGSGRRSRFSIMADDGGIRGRHMAHRSGRTEVTFGPGSGTPATALFEQPFFRWLDAAWGRLSVPRAGVAGLECGFALGWLGYLGYELKRECGGNDVSVGSYGGVPLADAQLVFAARAVVLDHELGETWLLALDAPDAAAWLDDAERAAHEATRSSDPTPAASGDAPLFAARDSAEVYRRKVREAKSEITEGNTYEVCLTTTLEADLAPASAVDPWLAYRALRRRSPAPFAAFARFGALAVASTSPERFLSLTDDGGLRAEPIKGTRRRSPDADPAEDARVRAELAASPKDQAENLMIVDLLRNDLSHFAVPGSVSVSRLFAVETYATVHQLVSTVDARLRPDASRAEAVAAAFPPGSMTGAPKISTMDILDRLESGPRGVYSGAIGYFSRTGAADLSVVIRTLVAHSADDGSMRLTLGVGGAVVADSDPDAEHDEIRAKAFAVLSTLGAEFPD
ncbi:aminodeoxychorismate synthase component I [Sinomonas sp. JGH33]|uniref:aminodeoxychorismate synthase n=1 Tax=Sinomonas terricola TaxID=3110330 RepID=A0ABU5T2R0_9MICC|nr:aminodeoxychorismate synthase component I [Sinomonas sp. JGH33]MEA5453952.1 aminodeoxychorismate synthase component I [Sinomonas sp. JGH33]